MRQYQPIWEQIKKHKEATIVAPAHLHKRIIQAVRKEKWRDAGFRFLMSEASIKLELREIVDRKKGVVKFILKDVSGFKVTDF